MKIRKKCYDYNLNVPPYYEEYEMKFEDTESAYMVALQLAKEECDYLNEGCHSMFEVAEYYENETEMFHVAVIHYDKPKDDRENDCEIRVVTGYEII